MDAALERHTDVAHPRGLWRRSNPEQPQPFLSSSSQADPDSPKTGLMGYAAAESSRR
jgi:hypothetical protein